MLALPGVGFSQSKKKNNVEPILLGDWIEASTLFLGEEITRSDVADIMVEQLVTEDQDIASEIAESGWTEIESRLRLTGVNAGIAISGKKIAPTTDWQGDIARSFLLTLSLPESYSDWAQAHRDYERQGQLFERFCVEACAHLFSGWHVHPAGWSPAGPKRALDIADEIAGLLGALTNPHAADFLSEYAKDAGLDIFCFRKFGDQRDGLPMFMIQCASGANWVKKLTEPSVNQWSRLVLSSYAATRAMMVPFVVTEHDAKVRCTHIEGPLFDRLRILSHADGSSSWVSAGLRADLIDWLEPRIAALPRS